MRHCKHRNHKSGVHDFLKRSNRSISLAVTQHKGEKILHKSIQPPVSASQRYKVCMKKVVYTQLLQIYITLLLKTMHSHPSHLAHKTPFLLIDKPWSLSLSSHLHHLHNSDKQFYTGWGVSDLRYTLNTQSVWWSFVWAPNTNSA
jgi:hypothetical protein